MEISIKDGCFSYEVDWSKLNKVKDGFLEEYRPSLEECLESVLRLLENLYSREQIVTYIKNGVNYSGLV